MQDQFYGYEIKKGKYQVQKNEAKIVCSVFEDIISGKGPYVVAKSLNELGVLTRRKGGKWSHTMISKMIRNRRYCGEFGYPKIVNKSIQDEAIGILENRTSSKARRNAHERNKNSPFYRMLRCQNCGRSFCLYEGSEIFYWRCSAEQSKYRAYLEWEGIADTDVHDATLEVINELIVTPELIFNPGHTQYNRLEIVKVENRIKELRANGSKDVDQLKHLLQKKYQLMYGQYKTDFIAETMTLREKIRKLDVQSKIDREVLTLLIKEIQIDETGKATFIFINSQTMEKQLQIKRGVING